MLLQHLQVRQFVAFKNIIAHRGNSGEFTENTPEAIISALNWEVGGVEIDIHVSKDGVPFIHHDSNLNRIHGLDHEITETDSSVLAKHVTPLEHLVSYLYEYPIGSTFFVELKTLSMSKHGQDLIVPKILKMLEPVRDLVVIISFDYKTLQVVRETDPKFRIGLVLIAYSDIFLAEATELDVDYIFVDYDKLPDNLSAVWPGRWTWVAYEIDSQEQVDRLRSIGIHTFETKQVQKMVNLLHPESDTDFAFE